MDIEYDIFIVLKRHRGVILHKLLLSRYSTVQKLISYFEHFSSCGPDVGWSVDDGFPQNSQ